MKKFHHLFSSFLPHFDLISSIASEKVLPISFDNEVITVARPVPETSFFLIFRGFWMIFQVIIAHEKSTENLG